MWFLKFSIISTRNNNTSFVIRRDFPASNTGVLNFKEADESCGLECWGEKSSLDVLNNSMLLACEHISLQRLLISL